MASARLALLILLSFHLGPNGWVLVRAKLDVGKAGVLSSGDVGVNKCVFEGNLGPQKVMLYVFLVGCIVPPDSNPHTGERRLAERAMFLEPNATRDSSSSSSSMDTSMTLGSGGGSTGSTTSGTHGATSPLHTLGSFASHTATAATSRGHQNPDSHTQVRLQPGARQLQSSQTNQRELKRRTPNAYFTGFVFMHEVGQPVLTTQLEQPLTTLLWASGLPDYNEFLDLIGNGWRSEDSGEDAEREWTSAAANRSRVLISRMKARAQFLRVRRQIRVDQDASDVSNTEQKGADKIKISQMRKPAGQRAGNAGAAGVGAGTGPVGPVVPSAQHAAGGIEVGGGTTGYGGTGARRFGAEGGAAATTSAGAGAGVLQLEPQARTGWRRLLCQCRRMLIWGALSRLFGGGGAKEECTCSKKGGEGETKGRGRQRGREPDKGEYQRQAEMEPEPEPLPTTFVVDNRPLQFTRAIEVAAQSLLHGTELALELRSPRTGRRYPVPLRFRDPARWRFNPSLRREPGRLYAALVLEDEDLLALQGIDPQASAASPEPTFEVNAMGFDGSCPWTPLTSRRQPVVPSSPAHPAPAAASGANATQLTPAPVCGWLTPQRQQHEREMTEKWRQASRSKKRKKRRVKGASAPPPPPSAPPAPSAAPTAAVVPTYVVLSPYFNLTAAQYVTLLARHVDYHGALGVHRHIIYVEEGMEQLLAEPHMRALLGEGRVELVQWSELPRFTRPGTDTRHPYASQILTYNHALLSVWHEAAVVAVADLDEYLVSSTPKSMEGMLSECAARGNYPAGALWIPRRNALCSSCFAQAARQAQQPMPPKNSSPKTLLGFADAHVSNPAIAHAAAVIERELWAWPGGSSVANDTGGRGRGRNGDWGFTWSHPLEAYRHWAEGWHHKSITFSHTVDFFGVHLAYVRPDPRPHTIAKLGCVVWLHLETQLGPKQAGRAGAEVAGGEGEGGDGHKGGAEVDEDGENPGEEEEEEEEFAQAKARAQAASRVKSKVSPIEHRYLWPLEVFLQRELARTHHWGDLKGPGFEMLHKQKW